MNPAVQRLHLTGPRGDDARSQVLSWDGRLDNRNELFLRFARSLCVEASDADVALAVYEEFGIPGLRYLIGDWSAVIADTARGTVILASDYMGVRPLYYHRQTPATILWSTRLKELVEETRIGAIDEQYAAGFLLLGGFPNHTPYKGIHSVPPGAAVCLGPGSTTVNRFWKPPTGDAVRLRDEAEYEEELRRLLAEAVSVRLRSDGPAIAELSGGLDSSSVVCMATRLMRDGAIRPRPLTTVSYDYAGSLDASFMREIEATCGVDGVHFPTDLHPVVSATQVGDALPACWVPLRTSVAQLARRLGASVFLTGLNGDLAMGNWLDDSLQVARPIRAGQFGRAFRDALAWSRTLRVPVTWILWRAMKASLPSSIAPRQIYMGDATALQRTAGDSLVPTFAERAGLAGSDAFSSDWIEAPPERRQHLWSLTVARELRTLQVPESLQGLDYTHPFAHRPLVEFAMSIPADVLCGPGHPRRLMRGAFADLWPARLRGRRSKSFFTTPWVEALKPLASALMKKPQWQVVERGWIDRASLAGRLNRLAHGLPCNEAQLRQIIILEYWLQQRQETAPGEWARHIA